MVAATIGRCKEMKRKTTLERKEPAKLLRLDHGPVDLVKCNSLREQAEPIDLELRNS